MAYAGNQTVKVKIVFRQGTIIGQSNLEYGTEAVGEYVSPEAFAAVWESQALGDLRNCLSSFTNIPVIEYSTTNPVGVPPFAMFQSWVGVGGNLDVKVTAPYVTQRVLKQPDNLLIEGTFGGNFKIGSIRLPGVPEDFVQNGLLDSAQVTRLSDFGESIETLDVSYDVFTDVTYDLLMVRRNPLDSSEFKLAPVLETQGSGVTGSQNTRKFTF